MKKVISSTISKAHSQLGKWVSKPTRSIILVCICGNKYIATRKNQTQCIKCTYTMTR